MKIQRKIELINKNFRIVFDFLLIRDLVRLRAVNKKLTNALILCSFIPRGIKFKLESTVYKMIPNYKRQELVNLFENQLQFCFDYFSVKSSKDGRDVMSLKEYRKMKNSLNGLVYFPRRSRDL